MSRVGDAAREGRIAGQVLWAFVTAPWVLVYPSLLFVLGLGGTFAAIAGACYFVFFTDTPILSLFVIVGAPIVLGPFLGWFATAYCHEVNELISGRRPWPLEGLVLTIPKLHEIVLVLIVGWIGTKLSMQAGASGDRLGRTIGVSSRQGLRIASFFAFPIVAISDGSFADTFRDFREVLSEQWSAAAVTTIGFQAISMLCFNLAFWPAVGLGAVNAISFLELEFGFVPRSEEYVPMLTEYAVSTGPLGPATVPLALIVLGFAVPTAITLTLRSPIRTIVTRYALDGELPAGLRADVSDLVDADIENPQEQSAAEDSDVPGAAA